MDQGIIAQLADVADAWKKSRSKMMRCAHPDTGGEPEAIQVFNVINSIMKDVIGSMEADERDAARSKVNKEFRVKLYEEAKQAVDNGECKTTFEYQESLLKGGC